MFVLSQIITLTMDDVRQLWKASAMLGFAYGSLFGLLPTVTIEWFGLRKSRRVLDLPSRQVLTVFAYFRSLLRELGIPLTRTRCRWQPFLPRLWPQPRRPRLPGSLFRRSRSFIRVNYFNQSHRLHSACRSSQPRTPMFRGQRLLCRFALLNPRGMHCGVRVVGLGGLERQEGEGSPSCAGGRSGSVA